MDVQVQAHIPEGYIESLSQRLEIYRRISDIRDQDDAMDVLDELIDRFGGASRLSQGPDRRGPDPEYGGLPGHLRD